MIFHTIYLLMSGNYRVLESSAQPLQGDLAFVSDNKDALRSLKLFPSEQ